MVRFLLGILIFHLTTTVFAQRRLPYPIILVHGWGGNETTFNALLQEFNRIGLRVSYDVVTKGAGDGSRIDFCLNADNNIYRSNLADDVRDLGSYINPGNDIFALNFDNCGNYSNQSAAVKQGYAIGLAIDKVLKATGASKVILFGHSMGGLAIREYFQNSRHWQSSTHRIAQIVTVGTPHGGSNSNSLGFVVANSFYEWSEAVRDLRWPNSYSAYDRGVYLYGGREYNMKRIGVYDYHNTDVNCDGDENDDIVGLNKVGISVSFPISCVIGIRGNFRDDFIVDADRATMNNLYLQRVATDYYANNNSMEAGTPTGVFDTWHSQLLYQKAILIQALDEPSTNQQAFAVDFTRSFTGFFQQPSNNTWGTDTDTYQLWVPQRGILTVNANTFPESNASYDILAPNFWQVPTSFINGVVNRRVEVNAGAHYVTFTGTAGSNVWRTYSHSYSFCPLPDIPVISASGATTICEGQAITLTATAGYDNYQWFRDGTQLPVNSSKLDITQAGAYSVQGIKCDNISRSVANINVVVNPVPPTPTVTIAANGQGLQSSSSEGNQWLTDGQPIVGQTESILPFSYVSGGKNVTAKVTRSGCSASSVPFIITDTEKNLADAEVKLFPNPATTTVTIETKDKQAITVCLYDLAGRLIQSKPIHRGVASFDIASEQTGAYYVGIPGQAGLVRFIKH